jgi:hypothetical protein
MAAVRRCAESLFGYRYVLFCRQRSFDQKGQELLSRPHGSNRSSHLCFARFGPPMRTPRAAGCFWTVQSPRGHKG